MASGGELSRIALAIAVTTSQLGAAQTLIFDEVDAGVGGAVAETVGRLMKQLGRDRQVLAVTHLPQVAACADHHLVVAKRQTAAAGKDGPRTESGVSRPRRRQPRPGNRPHAGRRDGLADLARARTRNARPQDLGDRAMNLDLVLITGMSGSGKSVALHALEDAGYYCVDNLPPELLTPFIALQHEQQAPRVAIAMDVRSGVSLPLVPQQLEALRRDGVISLRSLFLDATTDALVRRYSETRRRHPLSRQEGRTDVPEQHRVLMQAIELERELLADLRDGADVIDTSIIRPAQLQSYIKALISAPQSALTLVFESFAFKRGVPLDADYVFDVRMLPNPHYVPALRPLTGPRRAGDRMAARARGRGAHVRRHRTVPHALARRAGARPSQLCDGGHRLHRRAAPVGVPGRAAGARASARAGLRSSGTANSTRPELIRRLKIG